MGSSRRWQMMDRIGYRLMDNVMQRRSRLPHDTPIPKELAIPVMPDDWTQEKYVVFKREDLEKLLEAMQRGDFKSIRTAVEAHRLDNSAVIRLQDVFAGPVLHTYASIAYMVGTTLGAYDRVGAQRLKRIADYFEECADVADELFAEGRSHLPD